MGAAWDSLVAGYAELTDLSPSSGGASSKIYKEFTLGAIPKSVLLSVQSSRETVEAGQALSTIKLTKPASQVEGTDSNTYRCLQDHVGEDAVHKPITGSDWANYWTTSGVVGSGSVWQEGLTYQAGGVATLYEGSGTLDLEYVLDSLDITEHLNATGTYRLTLTVRVAASNGDDAIVTYQDLSLWTGVAWEITLDELAGATEKFVSGATFLEPAAVVEHFDCVKTTPAVTKEERLIAGIDDNTVLIFATGTPNGRFDTDDEDFGYPGMDKTLDEVQFESSAESPHTITIYASTDSGLTWELLGTVVAQRGRTCSVSAWITAVKHSVSFRGPGLHLSSYVMYAIPRGRMPKQ